jgi:hypothetical protein
VLGAHREVEDAEVYILATTRKLTRTAKGSTRFKRSQPETGSARINGAELRSVIGRPSSTVKVDFDAMDEIEQNEWLKRVLQEVKDSESGDTITIERRSLPINSVLVSNDIFKCILDVANSEAPTWVLVRLASCWTIKFYPDMDRIFECTMPETTKPETRIHLRLTGKESTQ